MRGRPPLDDRPITWQVNIPESVAKEVTELLPQYNGKPVHGVRSDLIVDLLRDWLSGRRTSKRLPIQQDENHENTT